ncbi:MAG: RHS repeat-associated core domain-containing protein, partial [Clostridia bacterium]|nr:RHS repeat-associated core domain-containing protein [Clostridia bacterium]
SVNGSKAFYNKLIYDYVTNADSESVLVSQLISQVGKTSSSTTSTTYNYTYDNNGNITQITNASGVIQNKYYYDALGQLVREDNRALNSTYTYSYDTAGNITSKKRYAFTTGTLGSVLNTLSYTYGDSTWKDLLTNYNGTSISYDTIGNPTTIGYAELTWQGRELTSYNDSESYELSFGYNADGIRTYKKVCDNLIGETFIHEYILNGTQIICEAVYYAGDDLELEERYRIVYLYDETGAPIGMKYREPSYAAGVYDCFFFEKNLQGDIIAVYNSNGTKLITYDYDAWGKCTTTYVAGYSACGGAVYNPFRYRGYYYDVETGWYYLQSRYYNPEWGRFLNADEYLSTAQGLLSYNTYTYCLNNSIMSCDSTGKWTFSIGWSFSAFLFGGVTYSVSLSFDSSGNIALQTSKADIFQESSGGTFGFASAGLSKSYSFTTLETVDDLNGPALNTGVSGSVYVPFSAGGEIISSPSNPTNIVGGSLSVGGGVGTPIEAHSTVSITETKEKINIFEIAKNAWTKFINWVGGQ